MAFLHYSFMLVLVQLFCLCEGNNFLAHGGVDIAAIQQSLYEELAGSFGEGEARLERFRRELAPLYAALPKNPEGGLEPAVVRYALRRHFVQTRAWQVNGLHPDGSVVASSMVKLTNDRVPAYIQSLIEKDLNGRGFGLHELAAFAATIELLAHQESLSLLDETFGALTIPSEGAAYSVVDKSLNLFMASVILVKNASQLARFPNLHKTAERMYPSWPSVTEWISDMHRSHLHATRNQRNPFHSNIDFKMAAQALRSIESEFGLFQNSECHEMKSNLMALEHHDSGRVLLSSFYSRSGNWQFEESPEYLRHIGALDESDPKRPSVVIPNYISSSGNCLGTSGFYNVCCMDECEGLMKQVEEHIRAPKATPAEIADFVAALPSDTVQAPRNLSAPLLERLYSISERYSGLVPLHSRLFAQWMHFAYPRECPYPHAAGTTRAMTPDEWQAQKGEDFIASAEEKEFHVNAEGSDELYTIHWSELDEMLGAKSVPSTPFLPGIMRVVALLAMIVAVGSQAPKVSEVWDVLVGKGGIKGASMHSHWV